MLISQLVVPGGHYTAFSLLSLPKTQCDSTHLEIRDTLARLYREAGRIEDARLIEEGLLKHIAHADPDHPIIHRIQLRARYPER